MNSRPKIPGRWRYLGSNVYEHDTGVRLHLGGLVRLADGKTVERVDRAEAQQLAMVYGSLRRGYFAYASRFVLDSNFTQD